ncbi:MAG: DUF309 domain-containing protein [Desulfobacterales bacterium]|jgi:hypothetical protein
MAIAAAKRFDPFADRTARDIRNSLSGSFAVAIAAMDPDKYLSVARRWREQNLFQIYSDYIADRLLRYDQVLQTIRAGGINEPLKQALVVWNQSLFFEFHEHLESLWRSASGDQREALKGLIKAAGVYIHLEQHHRKAAESLAIKSFNLLRQYGHCLTFIANFGILLDRLNKLDPAAPRLEIS